MENDEHLGLEMGRALTAKVAAEELPFYDELTTAAQEAHNKGGDHTLGFGGSTELLAAAAPILFEIGKTIVEFIWHQAQASIGELAKDAAKEFQTRLRERILSWIDRHFQQSPPVTVTPGALEELIETIKKDAAAKGLGEPELTRLTVVVARAFGQTRV